MLHSGVGRLHCSLALPLAFRGNEKKNLGVQILGVKGSFDIQRHLKITLREYWVSEMILIYSGNYCFGIDFLSVSETFRNNEESVKCRFSFSVWEGQKNYRKPMFSCYIQ